MRLPIPPYSLVPVISMTPLIPLGPAYIAASLKEAGFDVKIVDLTFIDKRALNINEVKKAILRQDPDVVGLSALTWTISTAYEIANALKEEEPDLPIVAGGPHVSALPERTLKECSAIDAVIIGEGEYVFRDFLNILLTKGICKEMAELKGLMFRHRDRILGNPYPVYIENLDSLPFPARTLFNLEKYMEFSRKFQAKRVPVASMVTSRGCPHRCIFCARISSGYRYRARSPENVIRELKQLKNYGFNEVQIVDDNFTEDRKRVFEICRLIKEQGVDMSFDLPNGIRVDHVDEELLSKMYDAGFYSIHLGVESGDDYVLRTIRKGITVKQIKSAVNIAKRIGFDIILYIIIGLPGSSVEAERRTLDLINDLDVPFTFSVCTPYPGSPLWEMVKDKLKGVSWDRFDETNYGNFIYVPDGMTKEQLQECIDRANEFKLQARNVGC
ncbi:hypothetical protein DRO56_05945 [Candidatus Bathyarchaeota archaeon]|nr:MAG: hypothetical protein DRO56_05945 [Candidatus Bathyarchaeota archaeon]